MVRIRLTRQGKTNDPFYRVVVIDKKRKNSGQALEVVGYWHPRTGEKKVDLKKIEKWVKLGAQPSKAVRDLMLTK